MVARLVLVLLVALGAGLAGCGEDGAVPPPTTGVPVADGRHFGYIRDIDTPSDPARIRFDIAEFLTGDAANEAALADGIISLGDTVPNDYYVRNLSPDLTWIPIGEDVVVTRVSCERGCQGNVPGDLVPFAQSFGFGVSEPDLSKEYRGALSQYWVTVRDGAVVAIDEQYVP